MFKKLTSIILSVLLVLSFAGCTQNEPGTTNDTTNAASEATEESTTAPGIETDEKLLTVEITLPASLFEGQDMSSFDTAAYVEEQGLLSATVNEDGSLTVTMTKGKHKELLDEMATNLDTTFAELVNGEDTAYIKEITHNDDFTAVTMKVDKAAYENAFDLTPLAIGISVAMYQAFTETEYHVEISIIDVATGDAINTITYPDALNG